jgi:hypothetical protein
MDLYEIGVFFWLGVVLVSAVAPALALVASGLQRETACSA